MAKTNTVTEIEIEAEITVRVRGRVLVVNGEVQDAQLDAWAARLRVGASAETRQESPIESLLTAIDFRRE